MPFHHKKKTDCVFNNKQKETSRNALQSTKKESPSKMKLRCMVAIASSFFYIDGI